MPKKNPDYHEWIKRQTHCSTCGKYSDSGLDPSHVKSRGSGGGDEKNLIPQCRECHSNYHRLGRTLFEGLKRVDMRQLANKYWGEWSGIPFSGSGTAVKQSPVNEGEVRDLSYQRSNELPVSGSAHLPIEEGETFDRGVGGRDRLVPKAKKRGSHGKV